MNKIFDNFSTLVLSKKLIYNQKTDIEPCENSTHFGSIRSTDINQVINIEPGRFETVTTLGYTSFDNDATINWNGALPSAPGTDQIGQRNDSGLPVYFPDPVTEQRTPNETINDVPTFEQVQG